MGTYYVDPVDGVNSTSNSRGTTPNNAWKDWSYALYGNRLTAGDTLVLLPGLHDTMWSSLPTAGITQVLGSTGDISIVGGGLATLNRAATVTGRLLDPCITGPRLVWDGVNFTNTRGINKALISSKASGKIKFNNCDIQCGKLSENVLIVGAASMTGAITEVEGGVIHNCSHVASTPKSVVTYKGVEVYDCGYLYILSEGEGVSIEGCNIHDLSVSSTIYSYSGFTTGSIRLNKFKVSDTFTSPLKMSGDMITNVKNGTLVIDKNIIQVDGLDQLSYSLISAKLESIGNTTASSRVTSFGGSNYLSNIDSDLSNSILSNNLISDNKRTIACGAIGDSITNNQYWLDDFNTVVGITPFNDYYCAIPGSTIQSFYWNIDRCVEKYNPSWIVIYGGINNFGTSTVRDSIFISDIVSMVKDCVSKIISYGIKPIWAGCLARGVSDSWNSDIVTFNTNSIAAVQAITGAYAFDLFSALKESNANWATVYYDALADSPATNVHPNATGQSWIGETIGTQFLTLIPEWSPFDGTMPTLTLSDTSPANLLEVKVETNE